MKKLKSHYVLKQILYYIFHFDKWHLYKFEDKKYVEDIIKFVNSDHSIHTVVEIGCGLGDIVGNIRCKNRLGIDISKQAIKAAKILFPSAKFAAGTFDKVKNKKIDCLITVNFMHEISPEILQKYYKDFCHYNKVKYIIFDSVVSKRYEYNHKAEEILGQDWKLIKKLGRYTANCGYRIIAVYKFEK